MNHNSLRISLDLSGAILPFRYLLSHLSCLLPDPQVVGQEAAEAVVLRGLEIVGEAPIAAAPGGVNQTFHDLPRRRWARS